MSDNDKMRPCEAKYTYTQDVDSLATYDAALQGLTVDVVDAGGGYYLVLKTDRWAIDDPQQFADELKRLLTTVHSALDDGGMKGEKAK